MFDDSPTVLPGTQTVGRQVPLFPTNQIQTPIALFHGGCDTIPDISYILKNINEPVLYLKIKGNPILILNLSTCSFYGVSVKIRLCFQQSLRC